MEIDKEFVIHNLKIVRISVIAIEMLDHLCLDQDVLKIDDQNVSNLFKLILKILISFYNKDLK
jgi:hypothetical protein